MQLESLAFSQHEFIPARYTCDGSDISPPLNWNGVPEGTQSLVLICDDPDAPGGTWVHWVLYDLPAHLEDLPESIPPMEKLPTGGVHGINDFRKLGYGGPCPPGGTHRYFFKLYALDTLLNLSAGATQAQVETAMQGHILAEAGLMGRYARQRH